MIDISANGIISYREAGSSSRAGFPIFSVDSAQEALLIIADVCCEMPRPDSALGERPFVFPVIADEDFGDLCRRAVLAFANAYEKLWANSTRQHG